MNEEQIKAAKAAWKRDPETACQALLGCSAEDMFVTALRGCNQHKHKPGCPDAEGGGGDKSWTDKSDQQIKKSLEGQHVSKEVKKTVLATQERAKERLNEMSDKELKEAIYRLVEEFASEASFADEYNGGQKPDYSSARSIYRAINIVLHKE